MIAGAVRPLRRDQAPASAALHRRVLDMEFLARCGQGFLTCYHQVWIASPAGLALGVADEEDRLVGVLLGSLDPGAHVRFMLRRGGWRLGLHLASYALIHPRLGRELLLTRARRYARGLARNLRRRNGAPAAARNRSRSVGEVTHLMVAPEAQGGGVGRALLEEAQRRGRAQGLDELVLVTPPDLAARRFYEHLGWHADGEVESRSGEAFVRFRLPLAR
ncbi:MAG: GNAT family N-acetyltransferase [Acidimicrobiales bacterium]